MDPAGGGHAAHLSQAAVSRAERGEARDLTIRVLLEIADALGARVSLKLLWQGEALDRLLDAAHAGLVDEVVRLLRLHGWEVHPELTFNHFGERGSIDVLAWHPIHGALPIFEVKSVMPDVQALLSRVDRKQRIARVIATERRCKVATVSKLVVMPEDRTARRRAAEHEATLGLALPARTAEVRRWVQRPVTALAGLLFLPPSQRTGFVPLFA